VNRLALHTDTRFVITDYYLRTHDSAYLPNAVTRCVVVQVLRWGNPLPLPDRARFMQDLVYSVIASIITAASRTDSLLLNTTLFPKGGRAAFPATHSL
jgi:hypothetical protein